jgi:CBS domain-containing protein
MTPDAAPALAAPGVAVSHVMRPAVTTVERHAHLAAAAYLMKHQGDSALVVTSDDEEHRPLAILTDADISQAVADGRSLEETRIENLPKREPILVGPDTPADQALRTMLLGRVHHLPVVDSGHLVGIVDMSDLCRALMPQVDAST